MTGINLVISRSAVAERIRFKSRTPRVPGSNPSSAGTYLVPVTLIIDTPKPEGCKCEFKGLKRPRNSWVPTAQTHWGK